MELLPLRGVFFGRLAKERGENVMLSVILIIVLIVLLVRALAI